MKHGGSKGGTGKRRRKGGDVTKKVCETVGRQESGWGGAQEHRRETLSTQVSRK